MIEQTHTRRIRDVEIALQQHMELFGYSLIDIPTIANAEIFLTRAGNTIIEELFTFERYGNLLALRPEFTATVAHRYIQEQHQEPVRWQLSGKIFTDVPADYSLQYEQHTIGAELIGQNGALADAEIMSMAVHGIEKIGIANWQLVIGHVGLQLHLLSQFDLDRRTYRLLLTQRERLKTDGIEAVLAYLSDLIEFNSAQEEAGTAQGEQAEHMLNVLLDSTRYGSTMGGRNRHDIANRLLRKHDRGLEIKQIEEALSFLQYWGQLQGHPHDILPEIETFVADDDAVGQQYLDNWRQILDLSEAHGVNQDQIVLRPDLTKNWDYYTGIVFGIQVNDHYIASGGRYDGLTQLLGGDESFPSVGFAYYTPRLLDALGKASEIVNTLTLSSDNASDAIQWATALRNAYIPVKIVDETSDIFVTGASATYQNTPYTRQALIEELSQ